MTIKDSVKTAITELTAARATLPASSDAFIFNYGLKQLLADSHVSGESEDEREGLLAKKIDKILAGTLEIRESTRETDPLAKEITRLATIQTEKHFAKQGVKKSKVASADWTTVLNKFRVHAWVTENAAKNVAEAAVMPEVTLD